MKNGNERRKTDEKRLKKLLSVNPKEYARIIRQIWKEGRERATASIMEGRTMDREKTKIRLR